MVLTPYRLRTSFYWLGRVMDRTMWWKKITEQRSKSELQRNPKRLLPRLAAEPLLRYEFHRAPRTKPEAPGQKQAKVQPKINSRLSWLGGRRSFKTTGENATAHNYIYDVVLELPIMQAICPTWFAQLFIKSFDEILPATTLSLTECGQWELPQSN